MREATVGNNSNACLLSSFVSKALLCLDLKNKQNPTKQKSCFCYFGEFSLFSWSGDSVLVRCVGSELPVMSNPVLLIKNTCFGHIKHPLKHHPLSGEALCVAL